MIRITEKFAAVLMAVWLPLFAGNALAVSIGMQTVSGHCHEFQAANAGANHTYQASTLHQSMQQDQQADQNQLPHKDCGVCQLSSCGYMASASVEVVKAAVASIPYLPVSAQFQSVVYVPLVPPPLAA